MIFFIGLLLTTLMTALFATNYLEDMPFDIQMKIVDMSETEWSVDTSHLDHYKFDTYMHVMIRKDMATQDKIKHDSIIQLFRKLRHSKVTRIFAIQKVDDAVNEVVKYQDLFDFDLRELFSNLTLHESPDQFVYSTIYDWGKNKYVNNPEYVYSDYE